MTTTTSGRRCIFLLHQLAFTLVMLAAFGSTAQAATLGAYLYGIDDAGSLYEINPADQTWNVVAVSASSTLANSLAYDQSRQQLFFTNRDLDFQVWDRTSGSLNNLGNALSVTGEPGNAAYYQDAYWYFDSNSTTLNKASLNYAGSTPSVASITSFGIAGMAATGDNTNTFGDIAIDTAQGILYASTSRGRFYSVNLADPANSFQEIAASAGSDRSFGLQLSFNADSSVLYGHRYSDGSWYTIDTTNGAATQIAGFITTPGGAGFRDLGGAAAVPEPSTFALAAIGLAGGVACRIRRRRRAENRDVIKD
jgi:hypothetical protein